jgi:ABC-2 type transport system permease protein
MGTLLIDILSIGNNSKKKPKSLYAGFIFFVLVLGSVSFFYSMMIGKGLMMFNSIEVLPVLMMTLTSIIVLFTSTFKVKGTIFGFKDYDMVMSLPISTAGIVASRLILLYCLNMIFVCIVMVPMMIVYGILVKPDFLFYIIGFFTLLSIPLIPIVIASILGTVIAYAASRFRHSNLISIILSLGLMVAVMGVSFTMKDTGEELVNLSKAITDKVNAIYPLAGMYSSAISHYDLTAFLTFLAISLGGFLIYSLLVGKVFKKMNTLIMTGKYHANFKMSELRQSSPFKALYLKEIRRYFSSPLYVLNTGFGIVMLTIGAIALFFVDLDAIAGEAEAAMLFNKGAAAFIVFCVVMSFTSAASISLEGKSLWIIKSLPVSAKFIFMSKIAVNLTVIAPALLDAVLIGIGLKIGALQTFLAIIITIVTAIFTAVFGLVVNLQFPNFNWITETVVIKQSAAAMISVFTGMAAAGLLIIFLAVIPSVNAAYLLYIGIMVIVDIVLYRIMNTWGVKQFQQLS